ncbi:hypothetical protein, partial [Planomonospora algeriensis]
MAFYQATDGRVLARPAGRAEPPSKKLLSGRYGSADLIEVFLNPSPAVGEHHDEEFDDEEE